MSIFERPKRSEGLRTCAWWKRPHACRFFLEIAPGPVSMLHTLLLTFISMFTSVGVTYNNPLLTVLVDRSGDMLCVNQSANVADALL